MSGRMSVGEGHCYDIRELSKGNGERGNDTGEREGGWGVLGEWEEEV